MGLLICFLYLTCTAVLCKVGTRAPCLQDIND